MTAIGDGWLPSQNAVLARNPGTSPASDYAAKWRDLSGQTSVNLWVTQHRESKDSLVRKLLITMTRKKGNLREFGFVLSSV